MPAFTIFTDGGCKPNPGRGGWGAVIESADSRRTLSGAEESTTNNRMELFAAISALESLDASSDVVLYTDSSYLKNGITSWIAWWRQRDWKTTMDRDVLNRDLWERLNSAMSRHRIKWQWVRGHSGNRGNAEADRLATSARLALEAT